VKTIRRDTTGHFALAFFFCEIRGVRRFIRYHRRLEIIEMIQVTHQIGMEYGMKRTRGDSTRTTGSCNQRGRPQAQPPRTLKQVFHKKNVALIWNAAEQSPIGDEQSRRAKQHTRTQQHREDEAEGEWRSHRANTGSKGGLGAEGAVP
jgi:hypothetical protein